MDASSLTPVLPAHSPAVSARPGHSCRERYPYPSGLVKSSLKPQGNRKLAGSDTVQFAFWVERFAMWPVKLLALTITTLLAASPQPGLKPESECSGAIGACNLFRYFAVNSPMLSQHRVLAPPDRPE
jgi:hypothetical protein